MSGRRGGIPGPESRTGLVRPPAMSEAEFERRHVHEAQGNGTRDDASESSINGPEMESSSSRTVATPVSTTTTPSKDGRARAPRAKPSKPKRVQRMFALEEELDKKLWLYAIHVGKDRSDVVNDLLRPVVASMVLYDSRDRRAGRQVDPGPEAEQGGD